MSIPAYLPEPYDPQPTSEVLRVFPGDVLHLMPSPRDVAQVAVHAQWRQLVYRWFFQGLPPKTYFAPRPGIEAGTAFHHLSCILGSYQPSHEDKEAAAAFLAQRWFTGVWVDGELYGEPFTVEPDPSGNYPEDLPAELRA